MHTRTHERFGITPLPRGRVRIDISQHHADGMPFDPFTVAVPATVAEALDVATEYANMVATATEHRRIARLAYLAALAAAGLSRQRLIDELNGITLWDDRYPRPRANGWD